MRSSTKNATNITQQTLQTRSFEACIRGINGFKGGLQPRNNLVKDENGDLADSYKILIRGRTASLLLNMHNVSDVRQKYI
jgi:hypothetical protein